MTRPNINVTPLIDVLLVLLIIFMVVTPSKPSSIETKIPQEPKSEQPADPNPDTLVLTIKTIDEIKLNNESNNFTLSESQAITGRLSEVFQLRKGAGNTERTVFIKAPRSLDYGSVARIIDSAKLAGAAPVSLQIDRLD